LKILHTESSCGWGGQEIRILNEASGFIGRGHQVELVCAPQAEIYEAAVARSIPTHTLPIVKKRLSGLWAVRRWLVDNQERFDLINTHSSTDSWLFALANASLPKPLPMVRTRHVSTAVNPSWSTRWLYQSATQHIVTTGERLRQHLASQNGFALERMTSVPTGIDPSLFQPRDKHVCRQELGLPENNFLLGIVATLRSWKGHVYLFEALASLQANCPDCRLIVVGDGPNEPKLRQKLTELGIDDRVIFVGRQSNVAEWLNAFDLFCLPSYGEEGVPQSILQAMACALPVVSTPIGSISEAVLDGQTGVLVPARDSVRLADMIQSLYADPVKRQAMGLAGLAHLKSTFSFSQMLNKMEKVFYQVLDGNGYDE
jgi:glycosyltransferase involved in cell wall biosynthesis